MKMVEVSVSKYKDVISGMEGGGVNELGVKFGGKLGNMIIVG